MAVKLYVGNLPYSTTDDDLRELFSQYGTVESATVMRERDTDRSRGYGFVELAEEAEAQAAIDALHEKDFSGRPLVVNKARPREERPKRDFNGGGGGGSFRQRSW